MKSKRAREAAAPVEEDKPADIHTGGDEQPAKKRKRTDDGGDGSDSGAKKSKKDKKEKKEKKDKSKSKYSKESRKEKKEKRKDLLDLPEEDAGDEVNGEEEVKEDKKKSKKDEKTKEDKAAKETGENTAAADLKKEKKEKKEKKKDKKKNSDAAAAVVATETSKITGDTAVPAGASNGIDLDMDASGTETKNETAAADDAAANKADRHIVFVGNLPYSATAASISAHFASLSPIAVRCLTNKGDAKNTCRGIAFVEFANVWTQRTCLDRFHHSMFEDGVSPARKINVELTAGGGGKTQHRQDKIREKNIKLDENRAKRIEKEKTAKTENAGSSAQEQQQQQSSIEDAIHPSRRARVPGNRW